MHDICHDINIAEIRLSDEQQFQKHVSKDKISFNWESIPAVGFAGLILSIALFVLAKCFWEAQIDILLTLITGGGVGTALGILNERRRLKLIPDEEKRWHADYVAVCDDIERFSERLEAFRKLAKTIERTHEIDATLTDRYLAERNELARRLRVFLRVLALKHYEAVVAKNTDGRFRDTRDVSEQVFANRVRVAEGEAEIEKLLAKDRSPNEAEFRRLEAQSGGDAEREDEPVASVRTLRAHGD